MLLYSKLQADFQFYVDAYKLNPINEFGLR